MRQLERGPEPEPEPELEPKRKINKSRASYLKANSQFSSDYVDPFSPIRLAGWLEES